MARSHDTNMDLTSDALDSLLEEARAGSAAALGSLMEECRRYLLRVANEELPDNLRAKVAPSDIVQDSCLEAQVGFPQFNGRTRTELLSWFRTILLFNISNQRRRYCETKKRQVGREFSLEDKHECNGLQWQAMAGDPSPSQAAIRHEEEARVERAIEQLPEHFRQAVLLRQREQLTFTEIGRRLGRSGEAARKLWARGIEKLQQALSEEAESSHEQRD